MTQAVDIVGFMRFSIVLNNGTNAWKSTREQSVSHALATILHPDRLKERLQLAIEMPFMSLAAQTDQRFTFWVLTSSEMPNEIKALLADAVSLHPFLRIKELALEDDLSSVCESLISQGQPTITFRLDDDDAVHPEHVADLRKRAISENLGRVISAPSGLYVERQGQKLAFQEMSYINNAYGIAYFGADGSTIFHQGAHSDTPAEKIVVNDRKHAWIRSIHAGSDSGSRQRMARKVVKVNPAEAGAYFPAYSAINFVQVAPHLKPYSASRQIIDRLIAFVRR